MHHPETLQRAKENVDKFEVVGILEDLSLTLQVFEMALPDIFAGARIKLEKMNENKTGRDRQLQCNVLYFIYN